MARSARVPRLSRSPLPGTDVTRFANPPVTTPERTAFDLGRRAPRVDALVAVDALLHRRLVEPAQLASYSQLRRGWSGLPLLREVLSLRSR